MPGYEWQDMVQIYDHGEFCCVLISLFFFNSHYGKKILALIHSAGALPPISAEPSFYPFCFLLNKQVAVPLRTPSLEGALKQHPHITRSQVTDFKQIHKPGC